MKKNWALLVILLVFSLGLCLSSNAFAKGKKYGKKVYPKPFKGHNHYKYKYQPHNHNGHCNHGHHYYPTNYYPYWDPFFSFQFNVPGGYVYWRVK